MSKPANIMLDGSKGTPPQGPKTDDNDRQSSDTEAATRTDFPCSVAQERFWLLDRLDPGNASYNVAVRWRLEGRVATDLLEKAWLKIIERHEILRTTFHEVDGAPIQRVSPTAQFRLNEIDLRSLNPEDQQAEGDRIGVIEARAPFDVATGPLIRATLLRFSPTMSIILVTSHQIVTDGWSIGVMAREMGTIYQALRRDQPVALEPLAIQYADYSLWHLEWLRVRGTEAETRYWTQQLAGVKPFKVAPDRPRPTVPTTNGHIVSRVYPRDLTNRAQSVAADRGATLFAVALGALCATLARFTNESEIVVGTQVSDRDQVELEPMIGQFVNSLVLRNNLGDDPRFSDLIIRVRDTVASALEHRHIPIERLLGIIKGERSHANSSPISVNFIFQKTFIHNSNYGEFDLVDMPSLPAGAIYDLNFFMVERPDGWRFSCQFNTDQFEEATAVRILAYIENLFENAVANPSRRLSELLLCPPNEARLLFNKLNDTRALYPRDLSLAQLFEAQVLRAPDAVALTCDDQQLTYAQLNEKAERVAHYLRSHGVSVNSTVGVCVARSLELPIALLAVLKAGAAYVPLDPQDSPDWRGYLMNAAQTVAVIFQDTKSLADSDRARNPIDLQAALDDKSPIGGLKHPEVDAGASACLLFATGDADKSVPLRVSHRSLANLVFSIAKRPGIGERDVVVATHPTSQDRSSLELLQPLLTGSRLVIALDKDLASGRRMLHLLQRAGATVMCAAPALWWKLLKAGWIGYPNLKMICPAHELRAPLFEKLSTMGEVWTVYGHPAAIAPSSVLRVRSKNELTSLGEPVANTVMYVLDAKLQMTPVGASGEIYIGGSGVIENHGISLSDPSGGTMPIKLIRTGDIGRMKANGQIEYLGRNDDQFGLDGQRVDPAFIEAAFLKNSGVAEAAVTHGYDSSDEQTMTAYVVPRSGQMGADALLALLRTSLARSLPQYLIPSEIVFREALPRSANGQVDRRALSTFKTPTQAKETGRATSTIEIELAKIWATMLGRESVDATDSFFELGGHSLLAARMLAQVERAFGRRIKLATLFSAPTVRELAAVLAQTDAREFDFRQMVKIQPNGTKPALIGINNTGIYYGLAKHLGADQPVISLQLFDPSVPTAALPESLEGIAAGYVSLIRRVQPQGPYELMGWCVAGALSFEIARQLEEQHHEVAHLFLIDSWVPRYYERQSTLRGFVGEYSLRWQQFREDWQRYRRGEQTFSQFFANRVSVQKLKAMFERPGIKVEDGSQPQDSALETYDLWLLGYLQKLTRKYEPKKIGASITIIRSREEPTGWFFKEDAGWRGFTSKKAAVVYVDGNHFTMFADPGVRQLASYIASAIDAPR